jgi:hypothetical protein
MSKVESSTRKELFVEFFYKVKKSKKVSDSPQKKHKNQKKKTIFKIFTKKEK